ncbi:MAG: hypothetical protein J6Y94_02010, partial [Bacteriovoracaceae bacterium]|nr:hypothetical protein [Bacteriovoracaceae bacterium]
PRGGEVWCGAGRAMPRKRGRQALVFLYFGLNMGAVLSAGGVGKTMAHAREIRTYCEERP